MRGLARDAGACCGDVQCARVAASPRSCRCLVRHLTSIRAAACSLQYGARECDRRPRISRPDHHASGRLPGTPNGPLSTLAERPRARHGPQPEHRPPMPSATQSDSRPMRTRIPVRAFALVTLWVSRARGARCKRRCKRCNRSESRPRRQRRHAKSSARLSSADRARLSCRPSVPPSSLSARTLDRPLPPSQRSPTVHAHTPTRAVTRATTPVVPLPYASCAAAERKLCRCRMRVVPLPYARCAAAVRAHQPACCAATCVAAQLTRYGCGTVDRCAAVGRRVIT
jgi:hypothetical protein